MKRVSRHTIVVLLIALASSLGGMGVAVVAFGQSGGGADATVPGGGSAGTTAPLSPYTTTPSTTPTVTTPTAPEAKPKDEGASKPAETHRTKAERAHGTASVPSGSASVPSQAVRRGPTHLAFTGGEPVYVAAFGVALMLAGLGLHRRRGRLRSGR
jgi:hypothetical protein